MLDKFSTFRKEIIQTQESFGHFRCRVKVEPHSVKVDVFQDLPQDFPAIKEEEFCNQHFETSEVKLETFCVDAMSTGNETSRRQLLDTGRRKESSYFIDVKTFENSVR